MGSEHASAFEASLQGTATFHSTTADSFAETLAEAVEAPAIGVSLPFDGVELPDEVSTDWTPSDLEGAATGVTPAGMGIANYGTVTLQSREEGDELVALYPPRHVAVLAASDLVADMPAAFERLDDDFDGGPSTQILATGPSATADMGTLVEGVHGPKETHVVVLEDR